MVEYKRIKVRFESEIAGVPAGTVRLLPLTPEVRQTIALGLMSEVKEQPKRTAKKSSDGKK